MHKQQILILKEPDVDIILRRQLAKQGYRVLPKVGLSDALAKDPDDHLPQREFDYFIRAHLDFLVTRENMPVFAVEFDGAHHFIDDRTIENDVIKNRMCKAADLPLLRITSSEIAESDKITILDYMLMRYVAWGNEYPSIVREIEQFAATIPPDYDPDNLAVDLDPSFHFDLRHPFPARDIVVERLWRNHRIAWSLVKPERQDVARYLCDVAFGSWGPSGTEQFSRCTRHASVWSPTAGEHTPVFSEEVSVSLRSWLPLQVEVPPPEMFQALWEEDSGASATEKANELIRRFKTRVDAMWFPQLPGISTMDIAQNYAEYLGFRAVERWAKKASR
jgi:hypothetical protein